MGGRAAAQGCASSRCRYEGCFTRQQPSSSGETPYAEVTVHEDPVHTAVGASKGETTS